jgi:hypothetical protein
MMYPYYLTGRFANKWVMLLCVRSQGIGKPNTRGDYLISWISKLAAHRLEASHNTDAGASEWNKFVAMHVVYTIYAYRCEFIHRYVML